MKFYLAGPIWKLSDKGKTWRKQLSEQLHKLGYEILDPTRKKAEKATLKLKELRKNQGRNSEKVKKINDMVFQTDLRLIRESDAMIAFLPKESFSVGTAQEIFYCNEICKIPVFVITDLDYVSDVSVFLDRTTTEFFKTFDDFLEYLKTFDIKK